jgi:DNA-binding response OmpR family regulator
MNGGRRVLVVDDSPELVRALGRVLQKNGIEFETADSGEAALDILRRLPFEVVLTDFSMEKLNGAELTRLVRKDHPNVVVIGMSSDEREGEFLSAGAAAFFYKPLPMEDLLARLKQGAG